MHVCIGIGTPLPGLNIIVNDKDLGDNSRYVLAMRSQNSRVSDWFKIIPETALGRTNVLIRLVDNEGFDYDDGVTDVEFDIVAMYEDVISVSNVATRQRSPNSTGIVFVGNLGRIQRSFGSSRKGERTRR